MPVEDLETLEYKMNKRGFKRDDVFFHGCDKCGVKAVAIYKIMGRVGGRDIKLCHHCGDARSWRSGAGQESREEDVGFDLRAFLG